MQFGRKTIERKEIYQGPIFPGGHRSSGTAWWEGQAQRDLIFHNGAVAVLPITDEGKTILVKQYRKGDREDFCRDSSREVGKGWKCGPSSSCSAWIGRRNWLHSGSRICCMIFFLPLDFAMSGSNSMLRPIWKSGKSPPPRWRWDLGLLRWLSAELRSWSKQVISVMPKPLWQFNTGNTYKTNKE